MKIREAAIICHNEVDWISRCVRSILFYARPERIVVVCDSCTDLSASIARAWGAEVYEEKNLSVGESTYSVLEKLDDGVVLFMAGDAELLASPAPLFELLGSNVFQVTGMCHHECVLCGGRWPTRMHRWGAAPVVALFRREVVLGIPEGRARQHPDYALCVAAREKGWLTRFDSGAVYGIHHLDRRSPVGALDMKTGRCPFCRGLV